MTCPSPYREGQLLEITVGELPLFSFKAVAVIVLLSLLWETTLKFAPKKLLHQ